MDKRTILIQLDSDPHPSAFDRVVAVDSGVDEIFSYGGVALDQVRGLVHGAIFTRGPKDLKRTAIFIGGSDVAVGEKMLAAAKASMVPQLTVSVMLDSNGSNTTAAAAVRTAAKHLELKDATALVLGGTGPVGQRVVRLLAREGTNVRVASRHEARAASVCEQVARQVAGAKTAPLGIASDAELAAALEGCSLAIAAGAVGVVLLPKGVRLAAKSLKVAIDLNAVPPLGIEGVEVFDKAVERHGVVCYGAIGVGDLKMKTHRACVGRLFQRNDLVLDAEEIYAVAKEL